APKDRSCCAFADADDEHALVAHDVGIEEILGMDHLAGVPAGIAWPLARPVVAVANDEALVDASRAISKSHGPARVRTLPCRGYHLPCFDTRKQAAITRIAFEIVLQLLAIGELR